MTLAAHAATLSPPAKRVSQPGVQPNGANAKSSNALSGFFFGDTDYDDWYIDNLKETVKALKPIVERAELMIIYVPES